MLGHIIYNHEHLDDCRIQQEISKTLYEKAFDGVLLVHAYNGKPDFKYKRYLEDKFIKIKNRGHFQGASDLINEGLSYFNRKRFPGLKYVLVTAADTWILNVPFLKKIVKEMELEGQVLAASSWGRSRAPEKITGFSTDFFIIDIEWNRKAKLFPLNYTAFKKRFADFFYLQYSYPVLESAVMYKFQKYFSEHYKDNEAWRQRNKMFRRIVEREPVHVKDERISSWPLIGLYTDPAPTEKRKALKKFGKNIGPNAQLLISGKLVKRYNKNGNRNA
jgi:hypothetical protein